MMRINTKEFVELMRSSGKSKDELLADMKKK
jgi:hypothetical protein